MSSLSSDTSSQASKPTSLGGCFVRSCSQYPDSIAYIVPNSGSDPTRITYSELGILVRRWASGLQSLGLGLGDTICLIAENTLNWALLDWACQCRGITLVPIYPTLPPDQAQYIVSDCGATVVVCQDKEQSAKFANMQNVRIFYLDSGTDSIKTLASEAAIIPDPQFLEQISAITEDSVATIIYTSGTTGPPKGVVLTHKNFLWMNEAVSKGFDIGHGDVFFSFLPLSHVFARANDHFLSISLGCTLGFNRSLSTISADILAVKPTIMLVVPRFLEAMRTRITDAAQKGSKVKARLFNATVSEGTKRSQGKFAPFWPVLNNLVGSKIRERMGGRLRFFVSGGAAMPRATYAFYAAMGLSVLQGYGLTETTSGIFINPPNKPNHPDTVGEPMIEVEVKIADDSEILVRGPFLMREYFHLPEATAQAIDQEGWFHTGDVGVMEGNRLKITDRKKDLIVLGNGKNVAPQPIENELKQSDLIAEAVVLGDGMEGCIALVIPQFEAVRRKLGSQESDEVLANSTEVKALIKKEIDVLNQSLASFERIKRHALLPKPFSIESGELTPSLKVKRKVVTEKYQAIIAQLGQ